VALDRAPIRHDRTGRAHIGVEALEVVHPGLWCGAGVAKPSGPDRSARTSAVSAAWSSASGTWRN
jgi:hypothetical protein